MEIRVKISILMVCIGSIAATCSTPEDKLAVIVQNFAEYADHSICQYSNSQIGRITGDLYLQAFINNTGVEDEKTIVSRIGVQGGTKWEVGFTRPPVPNMLTLDSIEKFVYFTTQVTGKLLLVKLDTGTGKPLSQTSLFGTGQCNDENCKMVLTPDDTQLYYLSHDTESKTSYLCRHDVPNGGEAVCVTTDLKNDESFNLYGFMDILLLENQNSLFTVYPNKYHQGYISATKVDFNSPESLMKSYRFTNDHFKTTSIDSAYDIERNYIYSFGICESFIIFEGTRVSPVYKYYFQGRDTPKVKYIPGSSKENDSVVLYFKRKEFGFTLHVYKPEPHTVQKYESRTNVRFIDFNYGTGMLYLLGAAKRSTQCYRNIIPLTELEDYLNTTVTSLNHQVILKSFEDRNETFSIKYIETESAESLEYDDQMILRTIPSRIDNENSSLSNISHWTQNATFYVPANSKIKLSLKLVCSLSEITITHELAEVKGAKLPGWIKLSGDTLELNTPSIKDIETYTFRIVSSESETTKSYFKFISVVVQGCQIQNCMRCEDMNNYRCGKCAFDYSLKDGSECIVDAPHYLIEAPQPAWSYDLALEQARSEELEELSRQSENSTDIEDPETSDLNSSTSEDKISQNELDNTHHVDSKHLDDSNLIQDSNVHNPQADDEDGKVSSNSWMMPRLLLILVFMAIILIIIIVCRCRNAKHKLMKMSKSAELREMGSSRSSRFQAPNSIQVDHDLEDTNVEDQIHLSD